jgi:hypothetical protein
MPFDQLSPSPGVAAERVQGGVLDAGDELRQLLLEPARVRGCGTARHDVERPGMQASVLVTGQVHHRGHRPVSLCLPARPPVGSARGAVAALLLLRFPGPPAEPAVRFSPQRALHEGLPPGHAGVVDGVHGVGMR